MKYQEAVRVWGAKRLSTDKRHVNPDDVMVFMDFDEGFACCGGTQEGCYCSYAYGPSANVVISAGNLRETINVEDFNFVEVVGEIVKAADGILTD